MYQVLLHRYVDGVHQSKIFPVTDQPESGWYSSKQKAEFAYNTNLTSRDSACYYSAAECRISDEIHYDLQIGTSVSGNNEVAHPSVLFVPEKFNGYRFWMAITPLPVSLGGDFERYENPEIFVSDDGVNWSVPQGLINPIAPDVGGASDHNADCVLFLSPDRETMYCAWTELIGTTEKIQLKSSPNGIVWSSTTTLLSVATTGERVLSPAINWDPINDRWMMHVSDITGTNTMRYCVRDDLDGVFGSRTACTYNLPDGETDVWHFDIRRLPSGVWFGLMMCASSGEKGPLYPMQSNDGITWSFGNKLSERKGYKSGFVPIDEASALMYWGLTNSPDWHVELIKLKFDGYTFRSNIAAFEGAATVGASNKYGRYYVEDSFARSDNPDSLGTADSGESWIATAGEFNIVSNQATPAAAQNNIATIDVGFSDAEIIVFASGLNTTERHIALRLSNSSNFHRIGFSSTYLDFQRVGGVGTADLATASLESSTTHKVRVVCQNRKFKVWVDDSFIFEVEDGDHITETKFGIQSSTVGVVFDRIIISRLA